MKNKWVAAAGVICLLFVLAGCGNRKPDTGTIEYTLAFQGKEIAGTYEGELSDGLPDGQGTFSGREEKFRYEGGWKEGTLSGKGYLTCDEFLLTFIKLVDRIGTYEGELLDGQACGYGTFRTQNTMYDWYTYEGEWSGGRWNGRGKLEYDDEFYYVREGNFRECEFEPEPADFYVSYSTYPGLPYTVDEKTRLSIEEKADILTGETPLSEELPEIRAEELNQRIGSAVKLQDLEILRVVEDKELWGRDFMEIIAREPETGTILHLIAIRHLDLQEGDRISSSVLSIGPSVYVNEDKQKTGTFICALLEADKKEGERSGSD